MQGLRRVSRRLHLFKSSHRNILDIIILMYVYNCRILCVNKANQTVLFLKNKMHSLV